MAKRKTIIEEDDDDETSSSKSSQQQTFITQDNGWVWFIGILFVLLLWGIVGNQVVENNDADCLFGVDDTFCWFWDNSDDINIDVNIENPDSSQNQQSDGDSGLFGGY